MANTNLCVAAVCMCARMCVCTRILNNYKLNTYFYYPYTKKIRPFYSESQIPYFQNFMSTKVKAIRYPDFNLPHAKVCLGTWAGWVLDSGRQKNLAVWDVLSWAGRIVSFCESSSNGERSALKQHTVEGLLQMPMDTGSQYWSWRGGASIPLAMSLGNREGNYEKFCLWPSTGAWQEGMAADGELYPMLVSLKCPVDRLQLLWLTHIYLTSKPKYP